MKILRVLDRGLAAAAAAAGAVIRSGGLVILPTETVYGIALSASSAAARSRLCGIKGRDEGKPLARLIADPREVIGLVPRAWGKVLDFWPGPLTLVLNTPGEGGVGYRCPDHELAREVIRRAAVPVAATSANRSGQLPASTAASAARIFAGEVDLVLDAGAAPGGTASTVLDLTGVQPLILRPGPLDAVELAAGLGITPVVRQGRN